jgi:cytochrome c553
MGRFVVAMAILVAGSFGTAALASGFGAEEAAAEIDKTTGLAPDTDNGRKLYLTCAVCHRPEGWGTVDGYYPQIAGQLQSVLIKQLADIRSRHRDNPTMYPFTLPNVLGGPQEIADVTAYISNLPMAPYNGTGPGNDLELGKSLYEENCKECHGINGEGDAEDRIPALRGQHFHYLLRQFEWIRIGKRRNSDEKMVRQIQGFTGRETHAVLDYTSRLQPPKELKADQNWVNPDFPSYARPMSPLEMMIGNQPLSAKPLR